jgi:hypothetical protein
VQTNEISLERIVFYVEPEINLVQQHTLDAQHKMYLGFTLKQMELYFSRVWIAKNSE